MKKIIAAVITASLLLTGLCGITLAEDEAKIACVAENAGDANGDGTINAKDVTALMKYCAGAGELTDTDIADVNRDGAVNAKDVAVMLKYLAGFEVFPGHVDVQISESDDGRTVVCANCGYVFEGEVETSSTDTTADPSTDTTAEPSTDTTAEPSSDPAAHAEPNVFYITDFGAVSDGKTDCTEAIQAALDEAGKVGGTVIVPPGSYLTGELKMRSHTSIEGYSGWGYLADGRSTLVLNDADAKCLLDIHNAYECTIKGLCLNGKSLGKNVHGISLIKKKFWETDKIENPFIDEVRVTYFTGDGVHFEWVDCFKIYHSMLGFNEGAGLYIDGCDAFLLDNWFSYNKNCGILGGGNVSSITVVDNRVEWNGVAGIRLRCGDSAQFTGNFFDRSSGPAIWLGAEDGIYANCTVSDNIFRRSGRPGDVAFETPYQSSHLLFEKVKNTTVSGNTFILGVDDSGGGTLGIKSPDFSIVLDICDAIVVQGNAMKDGAVKESVIWDGLGECSFEGNVGLTAVRKQLVSDWDDFE